MPQSIVDTLIVKLLVDGAEKLSQTDAALAALEASQDRVTASSRRLKAANDETVASDEKIVRAKRTTTNELVRFIAGMDKASAIALKYANDIDRLNRITEEQTGTEEMRAAALQLATQRMEQGLATLAKSTAATNDNTSALTANLEVLNRINRITGVTPAAPTAPRAPTARELREEDIVAYGRALDDLRAEFNSLFAEEQRHLDQLEKINRALKVGAIPSQREYQLAIQNETRRHNEQVTALKAATAAQEALNRAQQAAPPPPTPTQQRINLATGVSGGSDAAARGADIEAFGRDLDQLQAKYDKLFAAELRQRQALEEINHALSVGAIQQDRYAAGVNEITAAYNKEVAAIKAAEAAASGAGAQEQTAHIQARANELDRLQTKYQPLTVLQKQYQAELVEIDKASKTLGLTEEERTAAIARTTNAHHAQVNALKASEEGMTKAKVTSGQLNAAVTNLGFQLNDVASGLISGQSPFTILAQQGGQVAQAFSQGGGPTAVLAAFRAAVVGMISPTVLAVAGIAAVVGVFALLVSHATTAQAEIRQLNTILTGMGQTATGTAEALHKAAERMIASGSSMKDALASFQEFIRAGFNPARIEQLVNLGRDLGAVLGGDGGKQLINALKGGVGATAELAMSLGVLTAKEAEHYEAMARSGKGAEALNEIIARLSGQIGGKFENNLSASAKAMAALSDAWRKFLNAITESEDFQILVRGLTKLLELLTALTTGDWKLNLKIDLGPLGQIQLGSGAGATATGTTYPVGSAAGIALGNQQLQTLVAQIIQGESGGVPTKTSSAGAGGLMQLMPGTAAGLGVGNVYDPTQNVIGGSTLIQRLLAKYQNVETALMAYYAGEGAVDKYLKGEGELGPKTLAYPSYILNQVPGAAAQQYAQLATSLQSPAEIEKQKKAVDDLNRVRKEGLEIDRQVGASADELRAKQEAEAFNLANNITGEAALKNIEAAMAAARQKAAIELDKENKVMDVATVAANRIADAYKRGGLAVDEEKAATQAAAEVTAKYGNAIDKTAAIETRRLEILSQMRAQQRITNAEDLQKQRDTQQALQLEIALQGQSSDEIQRQLTLLRAKQEIDEKFPLLTAKEKEERLKTTAATADLVVKLQEAQREQQRINELVTSIGNLIDQNITQQLEKAFSGEKLDDWGKLAKTMLAQIQAQIISMTLIKPAIGSVMSVLGFPGAAQGFGNLFGGGGSILGGLGLGSLFSGGGSSGEGAVLKDDSGKVIGTLSGVGNVGSSLFGGTGSLFGGGIGNWVNSLGASTGLFAEPSIGGLSALQMADLGIPGVQTGIFGGATLTASLGGVGPGMAAGSLINTLMGGNQLGGTIGSGIGSIAGSLIGTALLPGVGTILGGLLGGSGGGILGGLFGGKKKTGPSGGFINLETGEITGAFSGGVAAADQASREVALSVQQMAKKISQATGALFPGNLGVQTSPSGQIQYQYQGQGGTAGDAQSAINNIFQLLMQNVTEVSDTIKTVMAHVTDPSQLDAALAFAKSYDDIKKAADDAFSSVEDATKRAGPFTQALNQINTLFDQLTQQTEKYGLSLDPVNAALEEATKRLTGDFARAVDQAFNAATGADYLNTIQAITANTNQMLVDAQNVSATQDTIKKINDTYAAQLKAAFGTLTSSQLDQVITQFGNLTDALPALAQSARDAALATEELNRQTAIYQIQQNFDTAAQQEFLAQLRDLDRQRIAAQAAAKNLGLDDTQQAIIQETEHRAALNVLQGLNNDQLELARKTLAELNPAFASWVDEVINATAATQAAADAQARANAIMQAGLQIRQYLNSLETAQDFTSPESRLAAARGQFATQLALAQRGDVPALQGITGIADQLRQALLGYFATSQAGQQEWEQVKRALAALPGVPDQQQTATDAIVQAIVDTGTVTKNTITDTTSDSTQQIVGTTIATNAAIVDNARATARDIISATGDSSNKIVNTAIQTSDDIVRNGIAGSAQITGATTTGLRLVTDATTTGANGVIAATANTAAAVNYTTGAVQGGTTALLASNEANAKTLIAGSKEDTQNLLAQQESNANALLGANAAQAAALIDQNGRNAAAVVNTTNATATDLIRNNTTSAQQIIATAVATTDLTRQTANENTDNLIWSAHETSTEVATRNEAAVHTVELATRTGTSTLLAQQTEAAAHHAEIAQSTTNQSIAAAYDTTAALAARTEAASAQVAATAQAGTEASIAAATANTNQLAARTDAATAQSIAAAQTGTQASINAAYETTAALSATTQQASTQTIIAANAATAASISAAYDTTAALGARTEAASANVAATTQAGTTALLQQGAAQLAAIQAMSGLSPGDQQLVAAIYNTSANVIQTVAGWAKALYDQIANYTVFAVQSSENWSNTTVQTIATWGNTVVQNIAAWTLLAVQTEANWGNTVAQTVATWGQTITQNIAGWAQAAIQSDAGWGNAIVSTIGYWSNAIFQQIANYTDFAVGSSNAWNDAIVRTTAAWGNAVNSTVASGADTISRMIAGWGNLLYVTVDRTGDTIWRTVDAWGSAVAGVVREWGNATVSTIAAWSQAQINYALQADNNNVSMLAQVSNSITNSIFAVGDTQIAAIYGSSSNEIGAAFANGNSIIGAIGAMSTSNIAATYSAANSIVAAVGIYSQEPVVSAIHDARDSTANWLQLVYNRMGAMNDNAQYWDQTIYNMLAQIRDQLIAVAAFSNEMRGARQYIQLLTEVSIDFFEYSARHDGIQQSQLDMVVDNLRRQAFG